LVPLCAKQHDDDDDDDDEFSISPKGHNENNSEPSCNAEKLLNFWVQI